MGMGDLRVLKWFIDFALEILKDEKLSIHKAVANNFLRAIKDSVGRLTYE